MTQNDPIPMPAGGEHMVCPDGQVPHTPFRQIRPAVQALPQVPQLVVSKRVSTQAEPQRVCPVLQAAGAPQRPALHT